MAEISRVLITGGLGFIGTAVCRNLMERGIQPIVLDRKGQKGRWLDGVIYYVGDVRNENTIDDIMYDAYPDGVIHLAALLGTQETVYNPRKAAETNIFGSLNVFSAIANHDVKAVYIAVGNHWMNNPYSITKTCAERFALMCNKEWQTQIAVVRGLNVYGPGQKAKPVRKVMPNFVEPALRGGTITIYGSGDQVMDMIYIDDMAEVLVRALVMDHGCYDKVIEAGMGDDTTVNDLAKMVVDEVGMGKLNYVDMRAGEEPDSVVRADTTNMEKYLDYGPDVMVPLAEGVRRTVMAYEKQRMAIQELSLA